MVLAYNRAVVSELKDRLGKLFKDLGYGNLAKRIKIFTFHGLAKKYCGDAIKDKPFEEWEKTLLQILNDSPGAIMNQFGYLKHILVDEFQDIDETRMDLLFKLNELTKAYLFIIGDPNQSIYGYSRKVMDPYYYYTDFKQRFNPTEFTLINNHRSYSGILTLASKILTLPVDHQHLIPKPTKIPDQHFILNYAQIIDRTKERIDWWDQIPMLMKEKVNQKPYKQIAVFFRTNNEVYRGFQKIKGLNLPGVRIRIQGSLPYEFTRLRECHAVLLFLKTKIGYQIPINFKQTLDTFIKGLIAENENWTHFYIRVMHAIVLEYLEEHDDGLLFDNLLEFISELTYKDDGQLYKIYEKHLEKVGNNSQETEIVLTTMHKVKGLEFDCVITTPSYSNLAFNEFHPMGINEMVEVINEEKRLAFVAYTRARYRLIVFVSERELALKEMKSYQLPERYKAGLGIPIEPEIKKLKIGWAAKSFNFNRQVNKFINSSIKSGDFVFVKKRVIPYNGKTFVVHELFKENTTQPIGELAGNSASFKDHLKVFGFVVNEVVVWTFEDTCKFDQENNTDFARDWCVEARKQGYIYLVDFAGFGLPVPD